MKILFVHGALSSFTKIDFDILRSEHNVRELHFRRGALHLMPSIISAVRGVLWTDLVFSWFGSIHALVPFVMGHLLGRKCVAIGSGYDVAAMPEIDYGNMRPGIRRHLGLLVFHLANKVLAVSQFAAQEAITNAKVPLNKLEVIALGFAVPDVSGELESEAKRHGVITVGLVNRSNLSRKGLTTFVQTAAYLPEVPFTLIGPWCDDAIDELRSIAPANVEFAGILSDTDLTKRMQEAAVYVQVSAHEAFGMALAEAMLLGCVPVVTEGGSLPEVVGETGFYVPYGDAQATAEAICQALTAGPEAAMRARQRIIENFPLEKRRERLLQVIQDMRSNSDLVYVDSLKER